MGESVAEALPIPAPGFHACDSRFKEHVAALRVSLDRLLLMPPTRPSKMPADMPRRGVYVLSEGSCPLYVGRSNHIQARIKRHCWPGATHRMAAFAFRLAREATGNLRASYKAGAGSRHGLMQEESFALAFSAAKERIRSMDLRYVEEKDPVRQTLLEVYVAVALSTPYNDFDTH